MQKHSRKMKSAIKTFAQTVRQHREDGEMSRQTLADKLGLNPLTIRNLEQGKTEPMFGTVLILSKALGIKLDQFAKGL